MPQQTAMSQYIESSERPHLFVDLMESSRRWTNIPAEHWQIPNPSILTQRPFIYISYACHRTARPCRHVHTSIDGSWVSLAMVFVCFGLAFLIKFTARSERKKSCFRKGGHALKDRALLISSSGRKYDFYLKIYYDHLCPPPPIRAAKQKVLWAWMANTVAYLCRILCVLER